jgi:flagellar hook assembly protein FlgD
VRAVIAARGNVNESVTFTIYDELGREVRRLTKVADASGIVDVAFDGLDDRGKVLGDGVYYVVGKGGGVNDKRKIVIVPRRKR